MRSKSALLTYLSKLPFVHFVIERDMADRAY